MQYVNIGGHEFSKIVCGTNPIYGRSHFSKARDRGYKDYFTDKRILKLFDTCRKNGINTVETSANQRIFDLRKEHEALTKEKLLLIASTRIDCTSEIKSHTLKAKLAIKNQSEVILVHSQLAEQKPKDNKIPGLDRLIKIIHDAGHIAGISCHEASVVKFCEKWHPDIDVYLFPLNIAGHTYGNSTDSVQDQLELIQRVDKTFIIMKALGAGQLKPAEALPFVFQNIKTKDIVSIGFGCEAEVEENLEIYAQFCG